MIDGWVRLPIATAPRALPVAVSADLVVELPTRGYEEDVAAMYRGMFHGRPVVNGYSGWVPPHYVQVQADLREDCVKSLEGLRGGRSMDAVIWRGDSGRRPRCQAEGDVERGDARRDRRRDRLSAATIAGGRGSRQNTRCPAASAGKP